MGNKPENVATGYDDLLSLIAEEDLPKDLDRRKLQLVWKQIIINQKNAFTRKELVQLCKNAKIKWGIGPVNRAVKFLMGKNLLKNVGNEKYYFVNWEFILPILEKKINEDSGYNDLKLGQTDAEPL